MSEIIDLDKLLPEPKEIKISGKILKLYPGKVKTIIKIQKAFAGFKEASPEDQSKSLTSLVDILAEIIPGIKNDDVDISVEQLPKIIDLAYQSSVPENVELPKKADGSTDEKKTLKT
jgi:hypothetical protein